MRVCHPFFFCPFGLSWCTWTWGALTTIVIYGNNKRYPPKYIVRIWEANTHALLLCVYLLPLPIQTQCSFGAAFVFFSSIGRLWKTVNRPISIRAILNTYSWLCFSKNQIINSCIYSKVLKLVGKKKSNNWLIYLIRFSNLLKEISNNQNPKSNAFLYCFFHKSHRFFKVFEITKTMVLWLLVENILKIKIHDSLKIQIIIHTQHQFFHNNFWDFLSNIIYYFSFINFEPSLFLLWFLSTFNHIFLLTL